MAKTVADEMRHAHAGQGADDASHTASGEVSAMPDRPPIRKLWAVFAGITLIVVASVVGVTEMFKLYADRTKGDRDLAVPSRELHDLRAAEDEETGSFGVIDEEAGRYRIPVERAKKRLLANPDLIRPLAEPPAPEESATGAPGAGAPGAGTPGTGVPAAASPDAGSTGTGRGEGADTR